MSGTTSSWRHFPEVFHGLKPPLRPSACDVDCIRDALENDVGHILLLGVTPELSVLGKTLVAADNSQRMIDRVWPGDRNGRRAILADWTRLPFDDDSFDAVIGDAPLNAAPRQVEEVLREVRRVVKPGGQAIFRNFCRPERIEHLETIKADAEAGLAGNVHAVKWRIAMSLAGSIDGGIVSVASILDAFERLFPDRAALARMTGWTAEEIATLDAYVRAEHSLGFPTLAEVLEWAAPYFDHQATVYSSAYPLAERCPIVSWRSVSA